MDLQVHAQVEKANHDPVGKVEWVVMDPGSLEVTHIVVQKGSLFKADKVVPVGWIDKTSGNEIILKPNLPEFDTLPDFKEDDFVQMEVNEPLRLPGGEDQAAETYYFYPRVAAAYAGS